LALAIALFASALCSTAAAQQWGNLTGRFVYDGAPPAPAPLTITKNIELCGKFKLVNETITVGKDGGIKNVAALLYLSEGETAPTHESYAEAFKLPVELDNKNCRFEPHVATIRVGQQLLIKNSDPEGHNSKLDSFANVPINPIIPAGASVEHKFDVAERFPVNVSCAIHPWMNAQLYVTDHPYAAISGEDGTFTIKNLPVGKWTFLFRHETGYVQDVNWKGDTTKWNKGRVELEIKPGDNDMGVIKFKPE
jgi:plastocyanin